MNCIDGKEILKELIHRAGYSSILEVVAEHTLFTHPETVKQTGNHNLFRIIRNAHLRGNIVDYEDGKKVMYCDNEGPNRAFVWSNGGIKYSDVQFNHIYSDSQNVQIYTSLANICLTPAFLAKLTDTDEEVKKLLKYRSYDLYGFYMGEPPERPVDYDKLHWKEFLGPIQNLGEYLLMRLQRSRKARSAISSAKIGWYFSDYKPDSRIG